MCGGGGSSVQAPDPMKEAEAQIAQLRAQYDMDQQLAEQNATREAEKEAADRAQWETDLGSSRAQAQKNIGTAFDRAGVDAGAYDDRILAALDLEQGSKSYGGDTGFASNLGTDILGDIRNANIRDYQSSFDKFAGSGFAEDAFKSTADDAIIDAIIGEQFTEASDAIMRAQARGTLNDQGFRYAMDNLDTAKQGANSRLQGIGGGVLEGYRGELTGLAEKGRTEAGNWDFGKTFDPNTYNKQITTRQGELSGGLEGDIRNTIGGEQFFDINSLIQKGGVAQGPINNTSNSPALLQALSKRNEDESKDRGLGTQGSF